MISWGTPPESDLPRFLVELNSRLGEGSLPNRDHRLALDQTEPALDACEEVSDVGMELLGPHHPSDAAGSNGAAERPRQGSFGSEQLLRVQLPESPLVIERGQMSPHEPIEVPVVVSDPKPPTDRVGNQQVALDVAPAPGKELQAGLGGELRGHLAVAIQHADPAGRGAPTTHPAQVLRRTSRLASPQDHRRSLQRTVETRREPTRPRGEDVAIAGPLHVDEKPARIPIATVGALSKRHAASEIRLLPGIQVAWIAGI